MIHTDHLATPHKMTDGSGTVVWSAYYKPFGAATVTVSTITNNLRFPGQYFDVETGLNYNYFRDYNPVIGRYIQADPIGLNGGINKYLYIFNNPLRYQDPSGLFCVSIVYGLPWMKDGDPTFVNTGPWHYVNSQMGTGPESQLGVPRGGLVPTVLNAFSESLSCKWSRVLNYQQKYEQLVTTVTVCVQCGHTTVNSKTDTLTKEETFSRNELTDTARLFPVGFVIDEKYTCNNTPGLKPAD
jgi:RHS repeat-associated protein